MKFRVKYFIVLCLICLMVPSEVYAHPGRTDSNGCHYCRTNCAKWGLRNGEYHCHNGGSTSSSSNTTSTQSTYVKSSDNTLKSITVDGDSVALSDQMTYVTKNATVAIVALPSNVKATCTANNKELAIGENDIDITVKAENGSEKKYLLKITRLSNNTNIEIMIDGKTINFVDGKATENVDFDTSQLNYEYVLEDKSASVEVIGDTNLKVGENIIVFKVTAADGTTKEYTLTVNREDKEESSNVSSDNSNSINTGAVAVISLAALGSAGYGIYHFVKRKE